MSAYKCNVTGSTKTAPVASPVPAQWCEGEPNNCVAGAKQFIIWNQAEGNNTFVSGLDLSGHPKSPGYNTKMGFADGEFSVLILFFFFFFFVYVCLMKKKKIGAQNDIFVTDTNAPANSPTTSSSTNAPTTTPNGTTNAPTNVPTNAPTNAPSGASCNSNSKRSFKTGKISRANMSSHRRHRRSLKF